MLQPLLPLPAPPPQCLHLKRQAKSLRICKLNIAALQLSKELGRREGERKRERGREEKLPPSGKSGWYRLPESWIFIWRMRRAGVCITAPPTQLKEMSPPLPIKCQRKPVEAASQTVPNCWLPLPGVEKAHCFRPRELPLGAGGMELVAGKEPGGKVSLTTPRKPGGQSTWATALLRAPPKRSLNSRSRAPTLGDHQGSRSQWQELYVWDALKEISRGSSRGY